MSLIWGGELQAKLSPYTSAITKMMMANKYGKLNYSTKAYPSPVLTDEEWEIVFRSFQTSNDLDKLAKFSLNAPKRLTGLKFTEFFLWLSRSVSCVSRAAPNAPDLLEDTDDWDEK